MNIAAYMTSACVLFVSIAQVFKSVLDLFFRSGLKVYGSVPSYVNVDGQTPSIRNAGLWTDLFLRM
jgi:hypothetical protein